MNGDQALGELGCERSEEQRRLFASTDFEKQGRTARSAVFLKR
jgi:hypothetical protein